MAEETRVATFGSGCFWCTEAIFRQLEGVKEVVSGYADGKVRHPTYEQVCGGKTSHAEVCQVTYFPARISYEELLEAFWKTHDPTIRNRQGNDVGPQHRSVFSITAMSRNASPRPKRRSLTRRRSGNARSSLKSCRSRCSGPQKSTIRTTTPGIQIRAIVPL